HLRVNDLAGTGRQPLMTEDRNLALAFDGAIYNAPEIRRELEREGRRFVTRSDAEVLLRAYGAWGPGALTRLVGMFAVAVYDGRKRELVLVRDFFGIKPLYYTSNPWGFGFASEIRALLEMPGVGREANPASIYAYLRHGLTDHGPSTCFADIFQLPPAHYLR